MVVVILASEPGLLVFRPGPPGAVTSNPDGKFEGSTFTGLVVAGVGGGGSPPTAKLLGKLGSGVLVAGD